MYIYIYMRTHIHTHIYQAIEWAECSPIDREKERTVLEE